jgi:hypothetical protein
MKKTILWGLFLFSQSAWCLPHRFTALLDFIQPGPDQGKTGTCLYVASTGAMELLANKHHDVKDPQPFGEFDLSEPYLIHAEEYPISGKTFFEKAVYKFNHGFGINAKDWPLVAWMNGSINQSAWDEQDYSRMPQVELPPVETIRLFYSEDRWATKVLQLDDLEEVKEALVKYNSPILINYNDNNFWHVILVVGYDDRIDGDCYQLTSKECTKTRGSFYIRDSFGKIIEVRDYDWFLNKANSAFVVKLKDDSF